MDTSAPVDTSVAVGDGVGRFEKLGLVIGSASAIKNAGDAGPGRTAG